MASFTLVDKTDPKTKLTSMMRTTAWPASIVLQMMARGEISKRGDVLQERDVPAEQFLARDGGAWPGDRLRRGRRRSTGVMKAGA